VLIDCPVQIGPAAGDLDIGLVDEPPVTDAVGAGSGSVDELGREGLDPPVDLSRDPRRYPARRAALRRRGRTGRNADTSAPRPRSPHAGTDNRQAQTKQQTSS
jgi:hypothetical protein